MRCLPDVPIVINRFSSSEWSGSSKVSANGSMKTLVASSNDTLCFLRLAAALFGSHW